MVNGVAAELNYLRLTEEGLRNTILKVAENESFAKNMKERSKLYRDQPMQPLERAIWWVEYIIRNPNATHLRSPALNMNFFVAHSFDILFFSIFSLFLIALTIYNFVRFLILKKLKQSKQENNCKKKN